MKLYIPTSSLNIENILSTESISPYSFYAKRDFGYNKFYPIHDRNNVILLFSDIPTFTVDCSSMQCYPTIIEADIDADSNKNISKIKVSRLKKIDVYECRKTIFLQPNTTRILFYDKEALKYTRLGCDDSALNKLASFWRFNLIEQRGKGNVKLSDILKKLSKQDKTLDFPFEDNSYNRVKGFVCGYILGEIMSRPKEIAQMLSIQKRIYDIVSAINSGAYNYKFIQELEKLDIEYSNLDPTKQQLRKAWKDEIKTELEIDSETLDRFLRKYDGAEALIKQLFCKQLNIPVRRTFSYFGQAGIVQYMTELNTHISNLLAKSKDEKLRGLNFVSEFDLQPDYSRVMMSGEDKISMLFNKVLSRIIWSKRKIIDVERIRVEKSDLAFEVVSIIRNIWEDQDWHWGGSNEQIYFHQLRENIQDYNKAFDINYLDNIILQSIAAIILKGNDYKDMISYLESVGFYDYKYVMGLWGAITGYISIPREIYGELSDSSQFSHIYKDVSSMFGAKPDCLLEECDEMTNGAHPTFEIQEDNVENRFEEAYNRSDIKNKKKLKKDILAISKQFGFCVSKEFRAALLKIQGVGEATYKIIANIFNDISMNDQSLQPVMDSQSNAQLSIFENTQQTYFYNDPTAWDHIERVLPQRYHDRVRNDFNKFIREMEKPKMKREKDYQQLDEKDNRTVIDIFCRLRFQEANGENIPTREESGNLCKRLYEIYDIK